MCIITYPQKKKRLYQKSAGDKKIKYTDVNNVSVTDFRNRDIPLKLEGDVVVENEITSTDSFAYFGIDFFPATITGFTRERPSNAIRYGCIVQYK